MNKTPNFLRLLKGQTISKANYVVLNSPKKNNIRCSGSNLFFFGENWGYKNWEIFPNFCCLHRISKSYFAHQIQTSILKLRIDAFVRSMWNNKTFNYYRKLKLWYIGTRYNRLSSMSILLGGNACTPKVLIITSSLKL